MRRTALCTAAALLVIQGQAQVPAAEPQEALAPTTADTSVSTASNVVTTPDATSCVEDVYECNVAQSMGTAAQGLSGLTACLWYQYSIKTTTPACTAALDASLVGVPDMPLCASTIDGLCSDFVGSFTATPQLKACIESNRAQLDPNCAELSLQMVGLSEGFVDPTTQQQPAGCNHGGPGGGGGGGGDEMNIMGGGRRALREAGRRLFGEGQGQDQAGQGQGPPGQGQSGISGWLGMGGQGQGQGQGQGPPGQGQGQGGQGGPGQGGGGGWFGGGGGGSGGGGPGGGGMPGPPGQGGPGGQGSGCEPEGPPLPLLVALGLMLVASCCCMFRFARRKAGKKPYKYGQLATDEDDVRDNEATGEEGDTELGFVDENVVNVISSEEAESENEMASGAAAPATAVAAKPCCATKAAAGASKDEGQLHAMQNEL